LVELISSLAAGVVVPTPTFCPLADMIQQKRIRGSINDFMIGWGFMIGFELPTKL
jgi:hypothetical protein